MAGPARADRGTASRLFVSLDPPPAARRAAAEWGRTVARGVPGLRPVRPEAIHLTLAFLGSMPAEGIENLVDAIESVARPVPALETGAPVWLPKRRPRALALGLDERTGILDALRADLVREIGRKTGWEPDRATFLPHLTVARAGHSFRTAGKSPGAAPGLRFDPCSITLFRSLLEPSGARYEPLFVLPLLSSVAEEDGPGDA